MDDPMISKLPGIRQAYKILKDWHQEFAPRTYPPRGQLVPIRAETSSEKVSGQIPIQRGE